MNDWEIYQLDRHMLRHLLCYWIVESVYAFLVHWKGALCMLTYVKNALGKCLLYWRNGHLYVEAYLDSSYVDDKGDRKSTSGYYTYVGGNLVT